MNLVITDTNFQVNRYDYRNTVPQEGLMLKTFWRLPSRRPEEVVYP